MRRFLIALTGTIAGLAALLSFKSMSSTAETTASGSTATPAASSSAAGTGTTDGSGKSTASKSAAGQTGGTTLTGAVEQSPYGPTQVAVTLDGKKIVAVKVLQHTDDGTMSQQIDSNALPKLTSEALTAQSGKIDAVTGASYTSAGYIKSLQSALDKD